ncbi:hypothetical protein F5144DRAFT_40585 [Chaetomium tenue]|uniref:Uncharacterized protein n=1 Tax=Chaetomium tenue TaxID=1854479 RepID=A0ACB7PS35_9PEZI|nr:hypothetical protein F5144DRAFT_40585 [Chaetomium globosum]
MARWCKHVLEKLEGVAIPFLFNSISCAIAFHLASYLPIFCQLHPPLTVASTNPQRINRVSTLVPEIPRLSPLPRTGPGPDFRPAADYTRTHGKTKDPPGPPQRSLPLTRAFTLSRKDAELSQSNEGLQIEPAQWFDKERRNPSDRYPGVTPPSSSFDPHTITYLRVSPPPPPVAGTPNSNDLNLQHVRGLRFYPHDTPFDRESLPLCDRPPPRPASR